MATFQNLAGTTNTLYKIGIGGPQLKNVSGTLELRDVSDADYVSFLAGDATLTGGTSDAEFIAATLLNDDDPLTGEVAQSITQAFSLRQTSNSGGAYNDTIVGKITVGKEADFFNASGTTDNDSFIAFSTMLDGVLSEQLRISSAGHVTPDTTNTQDLGISGDIWANVWATTFHGALTGNADTVTTNADLTGDVTSTGNATTISAKAVDIAMLADGTDGELITWDVNGVATTVPVGSSSQVLTSNGPGTVPTFQAPAGGGQNLFETIGGDSGTAVADTTTDTLNLIGATNGGIITVASSSPDQVTFAMDVIDLTLDSTGGAPTDHITFADASESNATQRVLVSSFLTNSGAFHEASNSQWLEGARTLDIATSAGDGAGSALTIRSGDAGSATTGGVGGNITIIAGDAGGSGNNAGGDIILRPGSDTGSGDPGDIIFQDALDNTKQIDFDLTGITTANTRTLTIQDGDGTVAYLSDIVANQNSFQTITGDTGTATADGVTDTIALVGATSGAIVTVADEGPGDSVTFAVDVADATSATIVGADELLFADVGSGDALRKDTAQSIADLFVEDELTRRATVAQAASTNIGTVLPANAFATRIVVDITTAYDNTPLYTVSAAGGVSALVLSTEIDPATIATYVIELPVSGASTGQVTADLTNTPSVGASTVTVEYKTVA